MRPTRIQISTYDSKGHGPASWFIELSPFMGVDEAKRAINKGLQTALDRFSAWWEEKHKNDQGELL